MNKITKIRAHAGSAARGVMLAMQILSSIGTGIAFAETNPPSQITSYLKRVAFTAPNVPQTTGSSIKKVGNEYDLWCNG